MSRASWWSISSRTPRNISTGSRRSWNWCARSACRTTSSRPWAGSRTEAARRFARSPAKISISRYTAARSTSRRPGAMSAAGWQSGYATACKAVYDGSIPDPRLHISGRAPCARHPRRIRATFSLFSFFTRLSSACAMNAPDCAGRALTGMPQRFRTPVYPQWISDSESGNVARQAAGLRATPCRQLAAPPCPGFHGVSPRGSVKKRGSR
ncbi:protein of unknown function [Cupriavidus taiwanensis]|uniref:Uncharacterized protein n=1 Tax=Cupriavidus taiwanensis TaxID=164546 RepID=A0A7Z7NL69_9BURK|nr:protein of unknown function [Cupriavidus taiwanensis]SOZ00880.1 hypothetical protein CBM2595_A20086 [Cupriavidus taiwanensis]SOZ03820.1 hypothetical protein CBM2597_A40089 [Cupriavidus taiwanensis]SPC08502.1 hypothetical protein CBM2594_A30088 [Cupriavidus taiwanensis]SPD38416.1 protein of unknown function [Cupriavidus taiwanensis]